MTIHKAKGLAFEHVYVLQLHKGGGKRPQPRVEHVEGHAEYELLGARTLAYDRALARRDDVEENERVRTLYVAMTRARTRLVLAGVHPQHAARPAADSAAAMLARREGGLPDLAAAMAAQAAAGGAGACDAAAARFRFPALERRGGAAPRHAPAPQLAVEAVRREWEALAARRAAAAAALGRPFGAPISGAAHEVALEAWREGPESDEGPEGDAAQAPAVAPRDAAAAVGTAVHRLLERLDLRADLAAELERLRAEVDHELIRALPPGEVEAARERAGELLARFSRGPLAARLALLAPHVLARELPVLLLPDAAGASAPAGFFSGAVDLLYRDPQAGELVVADYKTDRIEAGPELREAAERYAHQGAGYVRAVQEALGLPAPPRFELWFLHAGEIVRA
jgi:ATP-dependent exoDNAse (exonuclease V) beta subunit